MPKITYTGKQYTITIPKDLMEAMNWKKGTKIYIGKDPRSNLVFLEKIDEKNIQKKNKGGFNV